MVQIPDLTGTRPRYFGLLNNVEPTERLNLREGFEIRPAEEVERQLLLCPRGNPVVMVTDPCTPWPGRDEDNFYYERLRRLMRAAHIVLRTCGRGGITIVRELVMYRPCDETNPVGISCVDLPYRVPWGNPDREDIGKYRFDDCVKARLREFFDETIWEPDEWDQVDPLFRFADGIYRTYDRDRFMDYYLCLEGLIVPEEQEERRGSGGIKGRLVCRGARLFSAIDKEGERLKTIGAEADVEQHRLFLDRVYSLRNAMLHGDSKGVQLARLDALYPGKEPDDAWISLALKMEGYVRLLIRFLMRNGKIAVGERKKFWKSLEGGD